MDFNEYKILQDKQPPPLDKAVTDKVLVEVDIDITRILLIDEVDGIFETQQFVNLSWKDPRIQFHNLKLEDHQNSLLESEKGMIWVPTVTFLNTARQERSQRQGELEGGRDLLCMEPVFLYMPSKHS